MATCRTAAIAADADPWIGVGRSVGKGKWVLLVHGVSRRCHELLHERCHVRHRVFDVIHGRFMRFDVGSWGGS